MPPVVEFFGELERLLGSLYPYRAPLGIAALIVLGLVVWQAQRRSVHIVLARWARRHRLASAVAGAALLAFAIPLGNYTLSPLWQRSVLHEPSPLEVAAAVPASSAPAAPESPAGANVTRVREGNLQGADAFHFGRGRVLLIEGGDGTRVLRFEGVSVRNGPDLFVYLSPSSTEVTGAANLGALKATDGDFNYEVPAAIDERALSNALIWCRQFGVLFASAPLLPAP